ncbi:hypothetical protein O181_090298 [Austropuccinia psidii MF-1]|uniref:Uncharacterized protein n=1 Tax=Austropuccinia psidii MF-1 TaxID=1389203 RepID=A0A9Q3IUT8_9BASI|nr:hypothetical protein [Austropuccinia psidii MF-1]
MAESSSASRHRANNFYGRTPPPLPTSKTDLDILIERHRFIRDADEKNLSWEDALAKKTYDQLFKEYAICDLTKWKEGKVAMRWRTASEVINGKGHLTCANLHCKHHESIEHRFQPVPFKDGRIQNSNLQFEDQPSFMPLENVGEDGPSMSHLEQIPQRKLFELQTQFGYIEEGIKKLAQVKLKLCKKCAKKMEASSQSKRQSETSTHSSHRKRSRRSLSIASSRDPLNEKSLEHKRHRG